MAVTINKLRIGLGHGLAYGDTAAIDGLLSYEMFRVTYEFQRPEHFLLLNYVARATSTAVVLNDEAQEFRWVGAAEAMGLDLNRPTRTLLVEALNQGLIEHPDAGSGGRF